MHGDRCVRQHCLWARCRNHDLALAIFQRVCERCNGSKLHFGVAVARNRDHGALFDGDVVDFDLGNGRLECAAPARNATKPEGGWAGRQAGRQAGGRAGVDMRKIRRDNTIYIYALVDYQLTSLFSR